MNLPLKWEFPGGKVEKNELPQECLQREILEELGVDIKILEILPTNRHSYSKDKLIELIPYRCTLCSFDIQAKEHFQIKWLSLEELETLDWAEADIPIVQHYIQNYQ